MPTIDPIINLPARNQVPAVFIPNSDGVWPQLNTFATQTNAIGADVVVKGAQATIDAATAAASASSAIAVAGAIKWVSGSFADGDARWSPTNRLTYRKIGAGTGATDPAADAPNWALQSAPILLPRVPRATNIVLGLSDTSKFIDITSGTFTQTFGAAASLAAGWHVYIRNSGSGDITLDPNASELIDGLTSYIMYPQECRLITCDGTAFTSVVVHPFSKTFLTSSTFTKPPCYSFFGGQLWGGGNSGQKAGAGSTLAQGGGGGGCLPFTVLASKLSTSTSITVGAGGAAKTTAGVGLVGTPSALVGVVTNGIAATTYDAGAGLGASVQNPVGFEGNNATAPTMPIMWGGAGCHSAGGVGRDAVNGGAGGGGATAANVASAGGTSIGGGNGGAASLAGNGVDGVQPSGGGGGTQTGTQSGAGANGQVIIWGVV
jgi:hypothetical protein